jgi:glycosyltransferase involved in cell wall biosynthesis
MATAIRVQTNFHELYIPFDRSLKRSLGALWQRAMVLLMVAGSHALSVTAIEWEQRLRGIGVRGRIQLIPVGSNIPQAVVSWDERDRLRKKLLGSEDGLLMAGFGARHDRDIPAALYGLKHLKQKGVAKLIWIGGENLDERRHVSIGQAMQENGLDEDDVNWMGHVSHPRVSELLNACDLMILPFMDGVSARRTSAIAALQHGLPLLTTRGPTLEPWFVHGENVYLIPVGDRRALADALVELARRPDLRSRLARGGRELYDAHFSWDVIADQVTSLVPDGSTA